MRAAQKGVGRLGGEPLAAGRTAGSSGHRGLSRKGVRGQAAPAA